MLSPRHFIHWLYAMKPIRSCGQFFRAWQQCLDERPGIWLIRNVTTGQFWRNRAACQVSGMEAMDRWENAIRWIYHVDAPKVEDAHSRALKTGRPQQFTYRVKLAPHQFAIAQVTCAPKICATCPSACALIVSLVTLVM